MEGKGPKRIALALLSAVAAGAIILGIWYVRDVIAGGGAFSPDWPQCVFLAFVVGLCAYFGPDAAQRKRNRQDLKDRFTKKG